MYNENRNEELPIVINQDQNDEVIDLTDDSEVIIWDREVTAQHTAPDVKSEAAGELLGDDLMPYSSEAGDDERNTAEVGTQTENQGSKCLSSINLQFIRTK